MSFTKVMSVIVFSLLFLGTFGEGRRLDVPSSRLAPASSEVLLNEVDSTYGRIRWAHGAFIYRNAGQDVPTFLVLNRQGERISSFTPSIPGSFRVFANDFDRTPDGAVVFSGQTYSAEGQNVPFLCWISANGQSSHVVRTAPYWPYAISVAPDGSVWTSGFEMINGDVSASDLNPDAAVFRHFDTSGKLVGSVGPARVFKTDIRTGRVRDGFMVATEDRVGWYGPGTDGHSQYVEILVPAMTLRTYPGLPAGQPPIKKAGIAEQFALTSQGQPFVSYKHGDPHTRVTYLFDRETKQWVPTAVPAIAGIAEPVLRGSDGEQLVFTNKNTAMFLSAVPVAK